MRIKRELCVTLRYSVHEGIAAVRVPSGGW
jgi:hypothetical protein